MFDGSGSGINSWWDGISQLILGIRSPTMLGGIGSGFKQFAKVINDQHNWGLIHKVYFSENFPKMLYEYSPGSLEW